MSQVTAGTVSVTNGSATVTGTGVSWASVPATAVFYIDGDDRSYELTAAPSGSTLVLTTIYQGVTNPASTYSLSTDFTPFLGLARIGTQDIGTRPLLRQIVDTIDAWAFGGGGGGGGGGGAVSSVFGRAGAVVAQAGDYTAALITDTASKVMMLATERSKLSGIADGAQVNPQVATTADAQAGTDTVRMMTSARTKESVLQFAPSGGGTALTFQDEGTTLTPAQTTVNFVGTGVGVASTGGKYVVTIPGVADEAVAGGTLTPSSITITARQTKYSNFTQSGATTFALNAGASTYNLGEAVFYFTATEDPANIGHSYAISWNANLVFATSGLNADLPTTLAPGTVMIVISFDEINARGLVYFAGGLSTGGGTGTDPNALPLAGGTMTGALVLGSGASIDGGGNFIANHIRRILNPGATQGLLSATAHSGNIVISGGTIEIPNVQGFFCEILIGGNGHQIQFGTRLTPPLSLDDWVTVVVTNPGYMHSRISYAIDQPVFSSPPPTIVGGVSTIFNFGTVAHTQTAAYQLRTDGAGVYATLLCVSVHANANFGSGLTWQATGATVQTMTRATNPGDNTGTQAYMYYLYSPSVGTNNGNGNLVFTVQGVAGNTMAVVFNVYSVINVPSGQTPLTATQPVQPAGSNVNMLPLNLTVPNNTLMFHVMTNLPSTSSFLGAWGTDSVGDCDVACAASAGTPFRAIASHKTVITGGASFVDEGNLDAANPTTKFVDTVVAFSGV